MSDRLSLKDKFARVLPLLEDEAEAFTSYVMGRRPDETTRHHYKWSKEGGLFYYRTGRYAGRFHSYGSGAHGDLIDFYAVFYLHKPSAKGEALRGAMAWLGLSDDKPLPDEKAAAKRRREREEKRQREEAAQAKKDAEKAAEATRRMANGLHPVGTPIEPYAKIERAIPVSIWPSCVVYDPQERAAAFAVTDDAGAIRALQHVALTPDGKKDNRYPGERAKNDLGPKSKGVVRFAGDDDKYLLIGEGPETAWTANVATGFEAWACLGGMYHAAKFDIRGRTVILLRDDDAETSGGYQAASKAARELRAAGHEVVEAWPFEQHRGNGNDFNDLAQESGIEAVLARIEQAIGRHSHARFELPLDKTEERVNAITSEFFDLADTWDREEEAPPPVIAAGFTVGVGKTHAVLDHGSDFLSKARERQINLAGIHAVPEHKLSDEVATRFNRMAETKGFNLVADVWRGREAMRPDGSGEKMCANIDEVKEAQSVFVDDIEKEVCAGCKHHPNNGGACAYLAQKGKDADYWIVSHNMLFAETPAAINKRGVGFVVVDEAVWQAGLIGIEGKGVKIVVDSLLPASGMITPPGQDGNRLKAIREDLAHVLLKLPDGWVTREAILSANIHPARIEGGELSDSTAFFARKQEWLRKVDRKQEPNWRRREDNKTLGRMTALWSSIDHILNSPDIDTSGRLRLVTEEGVRVLYVYGRDDIAAGWRAPTIAIDALHKPKLLAPYYPQIEDKGHIRTAAPHMIVEQAVHENWAKTYLDPTMGEGDTKKKRDKRRKAKAVILKQAARIGGTILLVGQKEVVLALKRSGLPSNIDVAWYGAVAGRDHWRDVNGIILLGAPEPTSSQVERMAGALSGIAPSPVGTPDGRYPKADAERLLRKGRSVVSIPADGKRHPDDLAETMRQHVTAGQIIQATGRGRGVRRGPDNPLHVVALTGAILPFPVDRFLTEADMAVTHADLQIAEGGIAFEDGTSAAAAYPDIYPSPGAAREAFRHEREAGQRGACRSLIDIPIRVRHEAFADGMTAQSSASGSLIDIPIRVPDAVVSVAFQKAGERQRPQRAWVHPALCADPRSAVEAVLGPLARFEVMPGEGGEAATLPIAVGEPRCFNRADTAPEAGPGPFDNGHNWPPEPNFNGGYPDDSGDYRSEAAAAPDQDNAAVELVEADQPGSAPPKEAEIAVPPEFWDRLWRHARDCGLRHCDVAEQWASSSGCHLSNIEQGRRSMTTDIWADLNRFLDNAKPIQGTLL